MAVLLTLTVTNRGSDKEFRIYKPADRFIAASLESSTTDLTLFFESLDPIHLDFPSSSLRETFLSGLRDGLDGSADFTLNNIA